MTGVSGSPIEAVLTLNATKFNTGIDKTIEKLGKFKESSVGIRNLNDALTQLESSLQLVAGISKDALNTFSRLSTAVNKMANGLKILQSDSINVEEAVNTMNSIFKAFQGSLEGTTIKLESVATAERQVATSTRTSVSAQLEAVASLNANRNAVMGLISGKNQDTSATERNTESTIKNSSAKEKDVASTNKLTSSTNRLKGAMSSLRMMGTMVGSMLAYNFAHKLLVATGETIHAKSEMEGYFKMLNFGQSDIDHFNKALDDTVHQFQRVNKYSLGETISSIGVEFNLSTQEMEKAMKVTSMITSEYLRAGRNANEASLAVKDVLQGQFQRLSRETGVKGEQLKEAGWSGDTTDVLGLMEALEKVGESRNWDVFAQKANSLNDILVILQNRFGEWSADMVNVVQPSIVNTFNAIMSAFDNIAPILSNFWKWINTDGWGQVATKIGLVTSAILVLMPTITAWRSGANLLQVANMSLTQSLGALIFGLNAETLATHTSSEAIAMKILGIKAEELEESSLVSVINGMIASRTAETVATDTATASNLGFVGGLYAMITGEAIAEETTIGLTGALGLLTGAFLTSPIGWFTVAVLGLASAFYVLTGGLSDSWDKMATFHETVNQGLDALKPYQDRVNKLQTQLDEAKEKYGENSDQVKNLSSQLDDAKGSLDSFNESLQYGTKITQELTDEQDQLSAKLDAMTRKNYGSFGHSTDEVDEVVDQMNAMGYGYDHTYIALQKLVKMQDNFNRDQQDAIPLLTDHGRGLLENAENLGRWNQKYQEYIEQSTNANTAENWWDWAWASLYAGMSKTDANSILVTEAIETKLRDAFSNAEMGSIFKEGAEKQITDFFNSIGDSFNQWADNLDWAESINSFWENFSNNFISGVNNLTSYDYIGEFLKTWNLENFDLGAWVNDTIVNPLMDWVHEGLSNPSASKTIDGGSILRNIIDMGSDAISQLAQSIVDLFKDGLTNAIMNIPVVGNIAQFLGLGQDAETDANAQGQSVAQSYSTGIQTGFSGLDQVINTALSGLGLDEITSQFTTNSATISSTASTTATDVSGKYNTMKTNQSTALSNMVSQNTTAFNSIKNTASTNLNSMRDSTSQVTTQMTNAWTVMKDSIIQSAQKIKTESENRFNNLSTTIGNFYRKIQNPSQWGGGSAGSVRARTHNPSPSSRAVGRSVFGGGYAGGGWSGKSTMSVASLKRQLCPNGDCGNIFDGYSNTDVIDVQAFLGSIGGEHGFGGWNFASSHNQFIKNKSDKWGTAPPIIQLLGGIATSTGFKVGEFNNGTPQVSFEQFQSIAQAIFDRIPYRLYYDSSWKGSWLGALQAGACNCYDGALALMALARTFGFSASMGHGTWTDPDGSKTAHVWAVINGVKMDTTGWQQRGSWNPSASAGGGVVPSKSNGDVTVNVVIEGDVYGVDDLDSKIASGIDKGLAKHFNKNYAVGI